METFDKINKINKTGNCVKEIPPPNLSDHTFCQCWTEAKQNIAIQQNKTHRARNTQQRRRWGAGESWGAGVPEGHSLTFTYFTVVKPIQLKP